MTTIQERLQMKRVPLDTWSTQEKLCLASSVVRSGDQNWMSVSRALKTLGDPNRPADWFSQKNCAAQYGSLLENVETPRRKKRASEAVTETPQESIVKKMTQQRIQELQNEMIETAKAFNKIKEEVKELTSDSISEARIRELNSALEATKRDRERSAARRAQWLKEREQRRGLLEKVWRRAEGSVGLGETPPGAAAPLLTSLLQSPGPHLMTELLSPSSSSSALSLLLEKTSTPMTTTCDEPPMLQPISSPHKTVSVSKTELMKIEKIKSELQEIEQQYRGIIAPQVSTANVLTTMPPLTPVPHQTSNLTLPKEQTTAEIIKTPEKIEIDDIEIKDEDVYAFSDIDLEIPPVSSIHKSLTRSYTKKETIIPSLEEVASPSVSDSTEVINSLLSPININDINQLDVPAESVTPNPHAEQVSIQETSLPIADVEMKEVLEEQPIKEEACDIVPMDIDEPKEAHLNNLNEKITPTIPEQQTRKVQEEESSSDLEMNQKVADIKKDLDCRKSTENSLENVPAVEEFISEKEEKVTTNTSISEETEKMENLQLERKEQRSSMSDTQSTDQTNMDGNIETDDDTPIEVSKEDKPGKKRDYSRKKQEKDESVNSPAELEGTLSNKSEYSDEVGSDNSQGSTDKKSQPVRFKNDGSAFHALSPGTPMNSSPNSPAPPTPPSNVPASPAPEHDKEYRSWKKAIILALSRLNTLKYASIFQRPITDDQAPGYSQVVKKPMDLTTIRKNIDNGTIKTTKEFQHGVLLMMVNALMYNRSDHRVFSMTRETIVDIRTQLNILLQAQGHATLSTPLSRQARPAYNQSRSMLPAARRKRGGGGSDTPTQS